MPNPPTRQIYLPTYKVNITLPAGYSDTEIADAIQRNKAQIQQASPVFAQGQKYLQNALGPDDVGDGLRTSGLGITEQQARTQGIGPSVQGAQDSEQYNRADQVALLRHYAAVRAINNANQHQNAAQIITQAQANLLPTDRLTAIGERATRAVSDVINTPLLNHALDYGAPGASQQLEQTQGYRAGLARGVLGFSSPESLGAMALLGPIGAEPMGAKMLLGAFGAPVVAHAYQRAQEGDIGGALGELTAASLPFVFHGAQWAQETKNAADYRGGARWMDENYGVDVDPPMPPLLPPGPDPNVYEAEFRPDRKVATSSIELTAPSDWSGYTPQFASDLPSDGIIDAPERNLVLRTIRSTIPTSYGQVKASLPTDLGRNFSSGMNGLRFDTQNGGLLPYRSAYQTSSNDIEPLSAGSKVAVNFPALSSIPLGGVLTSDPPGDPLTITSSETKALPALLGEQQSLPISMNKLFAYGKTKATILVTLPQLSALRNLAEQTTSLATDEPGSYNHATLLNHLSAAGQTFPNVSENGLLSPQIVNGKSSIGQINDFDFTRLDSTLILPERLNPTEQKIVHFDALRRRNDNTLFPAHQQFKTDNSEDINNYQPDHGLGIGSLRNVSVVGAHLLNGREIINPDNKTEIKGTQSGSSIPIRIDHTEVIGANSQFAEPGGRAPRATIIGTQAEGHLSPDWHHNYLVYVGTGSTVVGRPLEDILQGETLRRTKHAFKKYRNVLRSPVFVNPEIRDDTGGVIKPSRYSPSGWQIWVNGRAFIDPEDLIFILGHEAMHIARKLAVRSFDNTPPYDDRLHEITANKGAKYISGRPKQTHGHLILRPIGVVPSIDDFSFKFKRVGE